MSFASLDSTGELTRLKGEYERGNVAAGEEYFDKGVSYFRTVMIAMFCVLFAASSLGIISGGYLLVVADNETYHDGFRGQARVMGGLDIFFMFVLWAISVFAVIAMVRYEKAMKAVVHHMVLGGSTSVRSLQEHLQVVQKAAPPVAAPGQVYVQTSSVPPNVPQQKVNAPPPPGPAEVPAGFNFA